MFTSVCLQFFGGASGSQPFIHLNIMWGGLGRPWVLNTPFLPPTPPLPRCSGSGISLGRQELLNLRGSQNTAKPSALAGLLGVGVCFLFLMLLLFLFLFTPSYFIGLFFSFSLSHCGSSSSAWRFCLVCSYLFIFYLF